MTSVNARAYKHLVCLKSEVTIIFPLKDLACVKSGDPKLEAQLGPPPPKKNPLE